ncbi:DEAD/DEAH box helicase family protein, partial [bacterium]|nr:DEAD/DEAH box helicase family protein [bacterium]
MDKKQLSERDICTKYITPALEQAGWDIATQIREEFSLTKGRVVVRGKLHTRAKHKRADYVLFYKPNIPIAVIEAKDNNHSIGDGMQQGLGYSEMLQVPFVFSSNGDGFLFHNKITNDGIIERELPLHDFPTPQTLWQWWGAHRGLDEQQNKLVTQDIYSDGSDKTPRYYQLLAINKTIEAIIQGQNRILLVMATGTGKTFTAFQIIWRLWKAKAKKRILFLADRNILIDQTMTNDFKPFGSAMTKIQKRQADKSYEIYLSLYQAVTGNEEEKNIYKQFSPSFFDLIVIDECHRGSAAEDSAWREILVYFSSATQIGLTATPKETKEVSNIDYFGAPIYTYSLRQGIDDGFLAPYKVVRIDLDKDLTGWRPDKGMLDKYGNEIEDRIYNQKDFDKKLVLEKRTELVAEKISEFLRQTNRFDKTIVFCTNIDHAERMRQALVNENGDLAAQNSKYVMRITGDNEEGKAELDNFIFPESKYPVIATTSKLMSTGVDAQTCKLIVLDQRIQSMTEKGCFLRIGSAAEPMTQEMIDTLYSTRVRNTIGRMESTRLDLTFAQLKIYYQERGLHLNDQFMKNLELLTPQGKPNYAAYLLADENGVSIQIAKYADGNRVNLIENRDFGRCSLIKAFKNVMERLNVENTISTRIGVPLRQEQPLINGVAMREAVVNAIVHNDYSNGSCPKFEFFPDRFEITSVGGLPYGLELEDFFLGHSAPRNKEIMRVFRDLELVEHLGSGVPRILEFYGHETFQISRNFIRLVFPFAEPLQRGEKRGE